MSSQPLEMPRKVLAFEALRAIGIPRRMIERLSDRAFKLLAVFRIDGSAKRTIAEGIQAAISVSGYHINPDAIASRNTMPKPSAVLGITKTSAKRK